MTYISQFFLHVVTHNSLVVKVKVKAHYNIHIHAVGATSQNFHRPPGPHRYAQPPPGTYAGTPGRSLPPAPPGGPQMAPPTAVVAPSQAVAAPAPGMFGGAQSVLPPSGVIPLSYTPVTHHWFYAQFIELRQCWKPFSITDSSRLEDAFRAGKNKIIAYSYGSFLLRKLWFMVCFTGTF